MKGIGKIFDTKYGGLLFSLLCGAAYYIIVLDFILHYTHSGGMLLGFFFFPAIICGMALIIFKTVNKLRKSESFSKINCLIYAHLILIILSLVFLADIFLN